MVPFAPIVSSIWSGTGMSKHCEVCKRSYPDEAAACPYCAEEVRFSGDDLVEVVEGLLREILHEEGRQTISIEVIQKKVAEGQWPEVASLNSVAATCASALSADESSALRKCFRKVFASMSSARAIASCGIPQPDIASTMRRSLSVGSYFLRPPAIFL